MWDKTNKLSPFYLALIFLVAPVHSNADQVIVDSRFQPGADTLGDGVQYFLDTLSAIGFGEPVLVVPSSGSTIIQDVNSGVIDMGIDTLVIQTTGNPNLDMVLDLYGESTPFGLQPGEYISYLEEEGVALLEDTLVEERFGNVKILPLIANTGQSAAMARGPINNKTLSRGFLMRSFGFGQSVLKEVYPRMLFLSGPQGGSPGQIVASFNDGALYAAEFVNPCIDYTAIIDQVDQGVITEYYVTNWQSPVTLFFLMYRSNLGDDFNLDLLEAAQQASLSASFSTLMRRQSDCLDAIRQKGVTITTLPTNVLRKLRAATLTVLNAAAANNPDFAAVWESQRDFVNRNRLWFNDGPIDRDFRFVDWLGWESDF